MARAKPQIIQSSPIDIPETVVEVPAIMEDIMSIEDWSQSRKDISPELRGGFCSYAKDRNWVYGTPSEWYAKYLSWSNSKA